MSKEIEELRKEVEATLRNFPESDFHRLLLIGIGMKTPNTTQAEKVAQRMGFSRKGQELARKIRKILTEDSSGDFLKVLKDLRSKESEMDKQVIQRFKKLEEEVRCLKVKLEKVEIEEEPTLKERVDEVRNHIGTETEVAKFVKYVVESFESNDYLLRHFGKEFTTTICQVNLKLNKEKLIQTEKELEKIGFRVDRPERRDKHIDLSVTLRKKRLRWFR